MNTRVSVTIGVFALAITGAITTTRATIAQSVVYGYSSLTGQCVSVEDTIEEDCIPNSGSQQCTVQLPGEFAPAYAGKLSTYMCVTPLKRY